MPTAFTTETDRDDAASDRDGFLVGNPVVETLAVMLLVSLVGWAGTVVGLIGLFVLAPPVHTPPWSLLTSVYAHAGPGHLLSNALLVVIAGGLVARTTTRLRFHAFFLATGVLAGLTQVWLGGLLGRPVAVLGASGAAFALVGYLLASNPLSTGLLDRLGLSPRVVVVIVAAVAGGLTLAFSPVGSALVAHFTGAVLGLFAGRIRLLRV